MRRELKILDAQYRAAGDPDTPPEILEALANKSSTVVETYLPVLCANPSTPIKVLEKIAKHKAACLRADIASSSRATSKLLEKLAKDKDWYVRYSVAMNKVTPKKVLLLLVKDPKTNVRTEAAVQIATLPSITMSELLELYMLNDDIANTLRWLHTPAVLKLLEMIDGTA